MATVVRRLVKRVSSKRFLIHWAGMFAALVGVVTAVLQLLPGLVLSPFISSCLIVFTIVGTSVYAWYMAKPSQLSVDDVLPEDRVSSEYFLANCVRDRDPARQVNQLAADVYPGVRPLPLDRYEQWMMINPHLLTCLFGPGGRVPGYFDVFPLRSDFMQMVIEGKCGENDIRREHVLRPKEAAKATRLYLGGIAVAEHNSAAGRRNACMLVWTLIRYLQHYYPIPPDRELFAEAATPEGERLLRKFRFELVATPKGRRDPFPLYRMRLTRETLEMGLESIPDWSARVRLGWHTPKKTFRRVRQEEPKPPPVS